MPQMRSGLGIPAISLSAAGLASSGLIVALGLWTLMSQMPVIAHGGNDVEVRGPRNLTAMTTAPVRPDVQRVQQPSQVAAWLPLPGKAASEANVEQQLEQARALLVHTLTEHERAVNSPEAVELRMAEAEHARAQSTLTLAQERLERLSGPSTVLLAAAEREVWRAEATWRAAKAARLPEDAPADALGVHTATIAAAEASMHDAVARRDQVRAGPAASEIEAARTDVANAQLALDESIHRLERARRNPVLQRVDATRIDIIAAERALRDIETRQHARVASTAP